ncbi:MAG TPA: FAD-dependent monooxygenase, partial [Ktedonobacteraceae bacterium]
MSLDTFDVVVVGARIAGSALSYQLGLRGWKVALIERGRRPLGGTLSVPINFPRALVQFRELGLFPAIEQVVPRLQKIKTLHMQITSDITIKGPIPVYGGFDYGYILRRELFDDVLLGYVLQQQPAITFFEGWTVVDLLYKGEQAAGVRIQQRLDTEEHGLHIRELYAPFVVGADGRFSKVAQLVAAKDYNVRTSYTTLFYSHCEGIDMTGLGEVAFVPAK